MAVLEPVDVAKRIRYYPYFIDWLQEINRSPEDVSEFSVTGEVKQVLSDTQWRRSEPTDNCFASITFKDGSHVERREKWSEHKIRYVPEEVETNISCTLNQ